MSQLTLYNTEGCHLCEMAYSLLSELGHHFYHAPKSTVLDEYALTNKALVIELTVEIVDIAFDECLFERYGVTIPVLEYQTSTLKWPFNLQELQDWLENNGITYHT